MSTRPRTHVAARGLLHQGFGPLVRVRVRSPAGQSRDGIAVIDTGASRSAVDADLARELLLPSHGVATWQAVSATASREMSPLRRAVVAVGDGSWAFELDLIEAPGLAAQVEGYRILALLGWDLLVHTVLTCDGPAGTFVLEVPAHRRA